MGTHRIELLYDVARMRQVWLAFVVLYGASSEAQKQLNAEEAFYQARALASSQRYPEACPLFELSYQLDPALGTLLNLADCFEKVGKNVEAFAAFNDAIAWAKRTGEPRREQEAMKRANNVRTHLVFLTIDIGVLKTQISIFSVPSRTLIQSVSSESVAYPIALELGRYVLELTSPGYKPFEKVLHFDHSGETNLVAHLEIETLLVALPQPIEVESRHKAEPSNRLAVISLAGGSVLAAAGIVGILYSQDVMIRVARQQPNQPDAANPTVTRAQFETVKVLNPISIGSAVVGVAGIVIGTVLLRAQPKLTMTVAPIPGGMVTFVGAQF